MISPLPLWGKGTRYQICIPLLPTGRSRPLLPSRLFPGFPPRQSRSRSMPVSFPLLIPSYHLQPLPSLLIMDIDLIMPVPQAALFPLLQIFSPLTDSPRLAVLVPLDCFSSLSPTLFMRSYNVSFCAGSPVSNRNHRFPKISLFRF